MSINRTDKADLDKKPFAIGKWLGAVCLSIPLLVSTVSHGQALAKDPRKFKTCPDFPAPAITLNFGSRYKADSKSRSDKDIKSDAEVTRALKPADDFVRKLSLLSYEARRYAGNQIALDCMISAIETWARADAFSDMQTVGAKISYPSRVGGIAIAYAQILPLLGDSYPEERATIEAWLAKRADKIIEYWEGDAPRLAKKANLRAWAALAIVQIGQILKQDSYLEWGLLSQKVILDTQDPDGSLPLEMRRGKYALHYQLHALAPMAMATAMLKKSGVELPPDYKERMVKAVNFTLEAIEDPDIVVKISKKKQTIDPGLINQDNHMIAWLEPYLTSFPDQMLDLRLDAVRPLSNTKLGGNLTDFFAGN